MVTSGVPPILYFYILIWPSKRSTTNLAAIDVLDSTLSEDKVDVLVCLEGSYKLGFVEPIGIILIGPEVRACAKVSDDGVVRSREVHRRASVVLTLVRDEGCDVGMGRVGTLPDPTNPLRHSGYFLHLKYTLKLVHSEWVASELAEDSGNGSWGLRKRYCRRIANNGIQYNPQMEMPV